MISTIRVVVCQTLIRNTLTIIGTYYGAGLLKTLEIFPRLPQGILGRNVENGRLSRNIENS